ncbi:MAG: glucose-1-phosphate adenylyltransferase subunit GlgD [Negativicutes bacterium]|nr:glucose-1-phosphate adenylyltransferase subunit GlgD [Negativicutes bacterium]MDR3590732.1 glucose-1-phosphate adenylyltransferase subunit GlgD [Negativicutes bacterium]
MEGSPINNVMGIINLAGDSLDLNEITQHRPLAAVPFGSRYRLIDFVLSGMVNSGIENVGVLVPHRHRSLVDHLRFGGDWNLMPKQDGLVWLPPPDAEAEQASRGDIRNFHGNRDFLAKSSQEYVVVAGAGVVGSIDYREALRFHEETAADITFLYKTEDHTRQDCPNCSVADVQPAGRLAGIRLKPETLDNGNFLLDTFILKKNLLSELIEGCAGRGKPDSIIQEIRDNLGYLRARAFHYPGYVARIHCLASYYRHSLDLLQPERWRQLFAQAGQIYTKVRHDAPTCYAKEAKVANIIAAGGCQIAGEVENSLLFRQVKIRPGARVSESILMAGCEVDEDAVLENVICDKDVRVTAGKCLRGSLTQPLVIRKGTVV